MRETWIYREGDSLSRDVNPSARLEAVNRAFPRRAEVSLVGPALQAIGLLPVQILIVTPVCQQARRSYYL